MRRLILAVCSVAVLACALVPGTASAASGPPPDVAPPLLVASSGTKYPLGFTITPNRAIAIAKTVKKMQEIHRTHHPLRVVPYVWTLSHYEIYFYYKDKLIADQYIGPSGQVGATYTGPLMLGAYARGGYGQVFDSPWVLIPFTVMFLLPLVLLRGRRWLDRFDIGGRPDVRRVLRAVRHRAPRAGRVAVLSAAHLPARADADPGLSITRAPRASRVPPAHDRARGWPAAAHRRADCRDARPAEYRRCRHRLGARRVQDPARTESLLLLDRPSRHLRPAELPGVCAVRADLAGVVALPAGGTRGRDHVRPADHRGAGRASGPSCARAATAGVWGCCSRGCGRPVRSRSSGWRRARTTAWWP